MCEELIRSFTHFVVTLHSDELFFSDHHEQTKQQHDETVAAITKHQRKEKRERDHCKRG